MRTRFSVLAVVIGASLFSLDASAVDAAPKKTIAVLPLRADALQLNEANRLNFLLRQRAATRGGYDVQSEETTTQLLEASQNLGLDCDVQATECGTQIGKIADVDLVMLGRASGGLVSNDANAAAGAAPMVGIDVRLIDVKRGAELRHVSALVPSEASLQTTAVNELSELLYGGDGALVALEVVALPLGCEVRVDGTLRGTSPLPVPVDALAPGPHHVSIAKKGYLTSTSIVTIQKGEAARLEITLESDPDALRTGPTTFDIALPFVVAGVGGALAIGGGVTTYVGSRPWFANQEAAAKIAAAQPSDKNYVATVTVANEEARTAANDWSTWGQGVTVAGITLTSIGVVAAAAGIGWGVYQLTRPEGTPDEVAP
jgi:hypothetical protein